MKRFIQFVLAIPCSILIVSSGLAQNGNFEPGVGAIGAGGGQSTSSSFSITGLAGEPVAGGVAQGGNYLVQSGFWAGPSLPPPPLYLSVILKAEPPIIERSWQQLGGAGFKVTSLWLQDDQLFIGLRDRRPAKDGLYKKSLSSCDATQPFVRVDDVRSDDVLNIVFRGTQGLVAGFNQYIFYSDNNGNSWRQIGTNVDLVRSLAFGPGDIFYAGTQDDGVYQGNATTANWNQTNAQPKQIYIMRLDEQDANLLWIGTEKDGVRILKLNILGRPGEKVNGLTTTSSRRVHDFEFDTADQIYIATYDGVFHSRADESSSWEGFGLQNANVQFRSLEIVDNKILYAGATNENKTGKAGVWRKPLDNTKDWESVYSAGLDATSTVYDLIYDNNYCKGLLAATDNGVWVYR